MLTDGLGRTLRHPGVANGAITRDILGFVPVHSWDGTDSGGTRHWQRNLKDRDRSIDPATVPRYAYEQMFDSWQNDPAYPTLYRRHEHVLVDSAVAFPSVGTRRLTGVVMAYRANGLRIEPQMPAELVAWVRCYDGSFLAVVNMRVSSANGRSSVTMQLWLPPSAITRV